MSVDLRALDDASVTFVGHEASRTGAPLGLLHLLKWLSEHSQARLRLILLSGGPLAPAYRQIADTRLVETPEVAEPRRLGRVAAKVADRFRTGTRRTNGLAAELDGADLIYVNTIASAPVLHSIHPLPPTVLHLHEMSYTLNLIARGHAAGMGLALDDYLSRTLHLARRVVVPSRKNKTQILKLVTSLDDRCHVVPEMVDIAGFGSSSRTPDAVRAELGVPDAARIVAGCGTVDWRKGTDLFVQTAARVVDASRKEDVYFLWVGTPWGPDQYSLDRVQFEFDVAGAGLEGRVIPIPRTPNPAPYLAAADVFLLTSREDPFPRAAIEAATLGKPIVCFESVGAAELVGDDAGVTTPYLDIPRMASAVLGLLRDEQRRSALGATAANRAATYDVSVIAPRLAELMAASMGR